jgi:hypothetical protein
VPDSALDVEKLDVLRTWGRGLQRDERQEVAAAGRAILLLIDEIERLHVELWGRRLYPGIPEPEREPEHASDEPVVVIEPPEGDLEGELTAPLRDRLRRLVGRTDTPAESTGEAPDA